MNSQKFNKEVYPDDFTEEDKLEFDLLLEQSKMLFPKLANEEWLISAGIVSYMRKRKMVDIEPPTDEERAQVKNFYLQENAVFYYEEPKYRLKGLKLRLKIILFF